MIVTEGKRHYVLLKDFNTFRYDHTLHRGKRYQYCLQPFRAAEKLKCHIKDFFEINGKNRIKMPNKGEYVRFKIFERKIKSRFMLYTDFQNILVLKGNGKENPNEFYTNKYQKYIACSYDYKLV